jgi:spore cortex biosynthesis protein YabQ
LGITFSGQAGLLLTACLLGFALGAVFDIFRVIRIAARSGGAGVFIQDIIYWLICAAVTFTFLLLQNRGKIRIPLLLSEAVGFAIYYNTIGAVVLQKVKKYDARIRRRVRLAAAAAIRPIGKFGHYAGRKIANRGRHAGRFLKKESKLLKIRLHVNKKMMYNLIQSAEKPENIQK